MNPLLKVDFYKTQHHLMMPEGFSKLYSNFTPRKSRIAGIDKVVFFGLQHFILEYLIKDFNENFFCTSFDELGYTFDGKPFKPFKKKLILEEYSKHVKLESYKHIEDLFDLGYLPIKIKALQEGTLCPIGVPCFTITNTHPNFAWLVNYLETLISCMMWQPITSATIAYEYKKLLERYALETTGSIEGVQWQGHDFSMRGMSSVESSILSGMGHLTSFTGTDTIPAIYALETSYNATGLIGASVPATEHSIQCMHYDYKTGNEDSYIQYLLKQYSTGIVSMVSDGFNLWDMITKTLPKYKDQILARDGKLVIRPDSGNPVDIICGRIKVFTKNALNNEIGSIIVGEVHYKDNGVTSCHRWVPSHNIDNNPLPQDKGVIELLWDIFGGTINKQGYKVLNSHIGAIYGDSITLDRAKEICERLKAKGFASTNIVLGIGSYTYQYNTRDTFGFAMKATYGEITNCEKYCHKMDARTTCDKSCIKSKEIFKDPITDNGTKKSKKGLLQVTQVVSEKELKATTIDETRSIETTLICKDQCTWEQEKGGLLTTVFLDGKLIRTTSLEEIRNKLK